MKGYGYYYRQIDFTRKDQFSRNYSDYFAFYNLLQDQDKPVVNAIIGFSLKHLKTDAQWAGRG